MKRTLLGALAALLISLPSLAQDGLLRADHPDSYTVVKGDTLWDISGKFLQSPWLWPEIWHVNPQIENPHLIYPGDVIRLTYMDGKPRLVLERGQRTYKMTPSGTEKLSPTVRVKPLEDAIPAIPLDTINAFLSRSRIVQRGELEMAPYVLAGEQRRIITGAGDELYARGEFEEGVPVYGIYRKDQPYRDPETGEVLGVQATDIGSARLLTQEGDIATLAVNRTTQEIRIEDRLLPHQERLIDSTFFPSAPDGDIEGQIMAVERGVSQVGQMDVVAINRGEREGVEVGDVFAIFKSGEVVRDRVRNEVVKLPDERGGLLMVFRTFEKMSLGLVLVAERPLAVNDRVAKP